MRTSSPTAAFLRGPALKDLSIPAQRKLLTRWVEERPDHRILREFVDEGESAYAPANKRPGFCERIAFCKKADVKAIVVHKLDRFSRGMARPKSSRSGPGGPEVESKTCIVHLSG